MQRGGGWRAENGYGRGGGWRAESGYGGGGGGRVRGLDSQDSVENKTGKQGKPRQTMRVKVKDISEKALDFRKEKKNPAVKK